jgi:hypothetical protein
MRFSACALAWPIEWRVAALAFSGLVAACLPRAARAEGERPVAILPVQTTDAFDQADGLTAALKRAVVQTPGLTLAEGEFPRVDVLIMSLQCGDPDNPPEKPDAACEEKIADQLKQDRFVWADLTKEGANVKGELHFYQRGRPTGTAPLDYTANLTGGADDTLIQLAKAALATAGGGAPKVRLRITAGIETGDAFADGEPLGKLLVGRGDFEAPAGHHKIVVKLPDGREMSSEVDVSPDGDTVLTLTPPPPPSKPLDPKIPTGFVFIGAGLAFAGGGLYGSIAVQSDQTKFDSRYKSIIPKGEDGCVKPPRDDLQELCDQAAQHKLFQEVFYPIGGALALTGVVLLGVSDWGDKAKPKNAAHEWHLEPVVGPTAGYLSVDTIF